MSGTRLDSIGICGGCNEAHLECKCSGARELPAPVGYDAALDRSESQWKEATAMAEAWCQEKDPYKRDRAIYCYRSGYLKALRHNNKVSDAPDSAAPHRIQSDE